MEEGGDRPRPVRRIAVHSIPALIRTARAPRGRLRGAAGRSPTSETWKSVSSARRYSS